MHTRNVNVRTAAPESSRKIGEKQNLMSVARVVSRIKGQLSVATLEAQLTAAMAEEAHAHYGEAFTTVDLFKSLMTGFFQGLRKPISHVKHKETKMQVLKAATSPKKVGASRDMVALLRIQATDTHVVEFDNVDTRFNDCTNWQVMEGDKRVLFSTRTHERFSDIKAGVLATIAVCENRATASDSAMLESAKAMMKVLDACPSFGALVAHPKRITD